MIQRVQAASSPVILIVMGVSGCGKSTIARDLAEHFACNFIEADDYHTAEARALMASGTPLTDAHREPWIQALCQALKNAAAQGQSSVMAYSGLRRGHRQRFRDLGLPILYLHLAGEKELIRDRMQARANHFMPAGLLDSQFASLEPTEGEADIIALRIDQPINNIAQTALGLAQEFMHQHSAV